MNTITSKDGTTIAFDRVGTGSPVIQIGGAPTDRHANDPQASDARQAGVQVTIEALARLRAGRAVSGDCRSCSRVSRSALVRPGCPPPRSTRPPPADGRSAAG